MKQPIYTYLGTEEQKHDIDMFRRIEYQGRTGFHGLSIKSRHIIDKHTVNEGQGTVTIWIMPFEDLATVSHQEHFKDTDPLYQNYSIISDNSCGRDYAASTFSVTWASNWYPQLFAKCFEGYIYSDSPTNRPYLSNNPIKSAFGTDVKGHKAFTAAGRFFFKGANWYQITVSWDKDNNVFDMYVNGIIVSRANSGVSMQWEKAGDILYVGNTAFAVSELKFYNECFTPQDAENAFHNECIFENSALTSELLRQYKEVGIPRVSFAPDETWKCKLDLKFDREEDLKEFYFQGDSGCMSIQDGCLEIKTKTVDTPLYEENGEIMDVNNMYMWSEKSFEGDLYVEFEFMPKRHNGFGIALFNATGLQREDFMNDYKRRRTGTMSMILWENVRSYNWGFFREMDDVRDDVATHIMMKNPWIRPLGYQCGERRMELNRWHKLQFIQEGNNLRGILDGRLLLDIEDNGFENSGPVFNSGHFGLRCMKRTHMMFRNLKIYNKDTSFKVLTD